MMTTAQAQKKFDRLVILAERAKQATAKFHEEFTKAQAKADWETICNMTDNQHDINSTPGDWLC